MRVLTALGKAEFCGKLGLFVQRHMKGSKASVGWLLSVEIEVGDVGSGVFIFFLGVGSQGVLQSFAASALWAGVRLLLGCGLRIGT